MKRRVVVTGMGAVTPIGTGRDVFWKALLEGKNGIDRITRFDPNLTKAQIAGEVKDFDPDAYIDKKESRRIDRYAQFAMAASKMAFEDSGLDLEKENRERIGVFIGSGIGGIETMHEQYEKFFTKGSLKVSPFFVPRLIGNMAAGHVSIMFGLKGPSCSIVTACASGSNCIGDAFRLIQRGDMDMMFAGGTEAAVSPAPVAGFAAMKALCTDHNDDPAHASRPFDKNRSGFIMGEGSGIVILEEMEHAIKRGAHIYAELAGYGVTSDAYHITAPNPDGVMAARCLELAIEDAGMKPEDIDYINAHGTSTHLNDEMETRAIKMVFGEHAKELSVSSIKSMTGHLLGAAGAVECIAAAMAVENDIVPPTINYETPDEGMDLDYVPNKCKKRLVRAALSDSFGFGGHNACLLLRKFQK